MTTAPAAITAVPPAGPPGPELDLRPLLDADPMTAVAVVLIAPLVVAVAAAAHTAVVRSRKGHR